jgi:hypothetical protein
LRKLAAGVDGLDWAFGVVCGLEIAADGLEAFLIIVFILFHRGYIVVGKVIALFFLDVGLVPDHDRLLLGLLR